MYGFTAFALLLVQRGCRTSRRWDKLRGALSWRLQPMPGPLCFIAMPFGRKTVDGRSVEFDAVWREIIEPGITQAAMQPLRADEELIGGIIHKPMFERLLLCEFAVADLTLANPNVFYELGVRHAARPATTVLMVANEVRLPFDVAMLRTLPYTLSGEGRPTQADVDAKQLAQLLNAAREGQYRDSPLYQLLDGITPLAVASDKTDMFRAHVAYAEARKGELENARRLAKNDEAAARKAIAAVWAGLGPLHSVEAGVLVDLLLSHRAVSDWEGMTRLAEELPEPLRSSVMVQEQRGLALNRAGRGEEAERVLLDLLKRRGPSSETLGILGRVYKDRWEKAADHPFLARALLDKAIDAYRRGFETDWRDHYPGVNAVTLMELKDPPDPERLKLIPVIRYSVERRMAAGNSDYWDWATLLEIEVLGEVQEAAERALGEAIMRIREPFEPETTARNLRLIREARGRRGITVAWAQVIEEELRKRVVQV